MFNLKRIIDVIYNIRILLFFNKKFLIIFRITHYEDCPCPAAGSVSEHNQVVPYHAAPSPTPYSPSASIYSYPNGHSPSMYGNAGSISSSSNNGAPVYLPPHSQAESGGVNGSHIAGIVSAVCSMIIMVVVAVIGFLKKYVHGPSSGNGSSNRNSNSNSSNDTLKANGSVKSGDSLDNNLMMMETLTGVFPNGKQPARSATFIV